MFDDIRDALRMLIRSPRTAMTVWLVMTLSLSAATTVFTVVDHVALRSLPFSDPGRLVAISRVIGPDGSSWSTNAPQDYLAWSEQVTAFESVGGSGGWSAQRLVRDDGEVALYTQRMTPTFLSTVGVTPALGRGFSEAEETPGQDAVVLLSDRVWRQYFGADPSVLGRQVRFTNQTREVIGVLPANFTYPFESEAGADIWIPFAMESRDRDPASPGRGYSLRLVARLAPGSTPDQAQSQISQVSADMDVRYSQSWWKTARPVVLPLQDAVVGSAGGWMLMALGAVGVVVLLASANVANLLLARAGRRARELAVRAALGASASRLRRVVVLESLTVALLAGVASLFLTWAGLASVVSWLPNGLSRTGAIAIDGRVFVIALLAAAVAGVLAGLVPARHAARSDVNVLLRAGAVPAGRVARSVLVVAQVAFVVVLVFATTAFVASFNRLLSTDLGFDYQDRAAFSVSATRMGVGSEGPPEVQRLAVQQLFDTVLARVSAIPGVAHVGYIDQGRPLGGSWASYAVRSGEQDDPVSLNLHQISAGYQAAAGLRLVEGRLLSDSDGIGAPLVMVLSAPAAQRLFPNGNAVGQTIEFRGRREVVGVVDGVRLAGPESERRMAMYIPTAQSEYAGTSRTLVVHSAGAVTAVTASVGDVIQSFLSPGQPLPTPELLSDAFDKSTASRRFQTRVMTAFGLLALAIGTFGVYSVISSLVVQQTREIGVRMALGATGSAIIGLVLRNMLVLVAIGLAAGLGASRLMTTWLSTLVFETEPASAGILGVVVLVVISAAVASTLFPAFRAARVNPNLVLRAD